MPTYFDNGEYDDSKHPVIAKVMAASGATEFEMANEIGISAQTLRRWRWMHPAFDKAIKLGKEAADDRVEAALYNRAVGYSFDSEKLLVVSQGVRDGSVVERHSVIEHVAPDPKAAMYWLNNRRPKEWKNSSQKEISGKLEFEQIQRDDKDMRV